MVLAGKRKRPYLVRKKRRLLLTMRLDMRLWQPFETCGAGTENYDWPRTMGALGYVMQVPEEENI